MVSFHHDGGAGVLGVLDGGTVGVAVGLGRVLVGAVVATRDGVTCGVVRAVGVGDCGAEVVGATVAASRSVGFGPPHAARRLTVAAHPRSQVRRRGVPAADTGRGLMMRSP